jgi:hypothetical protein
MKVIPRGGAGDAEECSPTNPFVVMPAKAGIHKLRLVFMGPSFRRGDNEKVLGVLCDLRGSA